MRSSLLLLGASALLPVAAPAHSADPRAAVDPTAPPSSSEQEIVATGTPLGTQTPTIVAKVNREQILRAGGANIANALAHPGAELAVVAQNLTDDVQRNASALNKDEVVLPGRTVRLVLRVASF